uniref:39S ribosomal protein L12, mitochondrial n=1 Tax=Ciona intestinalis TaxID=7719 RepID=F6RGQ1_CIOIN
MWRIIRPTVKCLSAVNKSSALHTRVLLSRTATTNAAVEEPLPPPERDNEARVFEPKIVNLVDSISSLTLREVADLNELLKSTLNIKDTPMMAAQVAAPAAAAEAEEKQAVPEKTEFGVKLLEFSPADKIKLIKAIKAVKENFNLVQAKKFVESLPQIVKDEASKEEAEEMKKILEEAGGKVDIV